MPLLRSVWVARVVERAKDHCKTSVVHLSRTSDGGDEETRTPDPLLAKEVLYQTELHPLAPRQAQVYLRLARRDGMTSGEAARYPLCSVWAFLDSNQRPLPYQGSALTT